MCSIRPPFVLVVSDTKILWLSLWGRLKDWGHIQIIRQNVIQLRPVQPNQFETNKLKVANVQIIACTLSALMRENSCTSIYIYICLYDVLYAEIACETLGQKNAKAGTWTQHSKLLLPTWRASRVAGLFRYSDSLFVITSKKLASGSP